MGIIDSIRNIFRREDEMILEDAEESDAVSAEHREEERENIEGFQADQVAERRFGNLPSDDV